MAMLLLKAAWLSSIRAPEGWLWPQSFITWAFSSVALPLVKFHDLLQKERAAAVTNLCCRYCVQIESLSVQSFRFPKAHLRRLQGRNQANTALFVNTPELSVQS